MAPSFSTHARKQTSKNENPCRTLVCLLLSVHSERPPPLLYVRKPIFLLSHSESKNYLQSSPSKQPHPLQLPNLLNNYFFILINWRFISSRCIPLARAAAHIVLIPTVWPFILFICLLYASVILKIFLLSNSPQSSYNEKSPNCNYQALLTTLTP